LIEGGYVLTNAHVVWPFDEVRVVFPDGSEHLDAPVLNWDLMGDLAVIGPLDTDITPLALVDGEDVAIGSDVYLIGYPGELEMFPQPTLSRGLISRLREWDAIEMTYFQTDALIAGGQSGGVLVSEDGEVIGISGFVFTEAGFGLAASAADVLPRVEGLIAGDDVAGLGDRRVPLEGGQLEHTVTLDNLWDEHMFVVNEPVGSLIDLRMEGENDAAIQLVDVFAQVLIYVDDGITGVEVGTASTELAGPYFAIAAQFTVSPGKFLMSSNRNLIPYEDVDDGVSISIGQTAVGSMDYPGDLDYFVIDLLEGDTIEITVDSPNINPFVIVDFPGATAEQVLVDDDSGGGLFGTNAKLIYRAPHTGTYYIIVRDAAIEAGFGGYILTVAEAPPGAASVSPPPAPTPVPTIDSPYGPMALYESTDYPFSIQYPADWTEDPSDPGTYESTSGASNFVPGEDDLVAAGLGEMTLAEFVDFLLSALVLELPDFTVVSRQETVNSQDLPIEIVHTTALAGVIHQNYLVYLHEGSIVFLSIYSTLAAQSDELRDLIDYSFSTFQVSEE
jgi:hypothetical protein